MMNHCLFNLKDFLDQAVQASNFEMTLHVVLSFFNASYEEFSSLKLCLCIY